MKRVPRYTFGPFSLDPEARVLLREGEPIRMAGKTLDTLLLLVQNRGRLVDKDELLSRVWAGSAVEEANLTQSIFTVRKILGDTPKDHRYIATVAGRGYQFVAPVTEITDGRGAWQQTSSEPVRGPRHFAGGIIGHHSKAAVLLIVTAILLTGVVSYLLRHPSKRAPELRQRRLTFNSWENPVLSAVLSPDGRYLAFSDAAGIHVKLLETGEERAIPTPSGLPSGTLSYVDSWFPDGTQLLAHSKQNDDRANMWVISVMGHSAHGLREGAQGWGVSPDGRRIAFSPSQPFDNFREIWVMDSDGNNSQKIFGKVPNEWLWSVRWSPDSRRLAYIRAQHLPDKYFQYVETCDLKGQDRKPIVVVSGSDPWVLDIVWMANGRIIYSRRPTHGSAADNLWEIDVKTNRGEPVGQATRLTQGTGADIQGLSADRSGNRLAMQMVTGHQEVLLAELVEGGTQLLPPIRLTKDESNSVAFTWTADSKAVIINSDRDGKPHLYRQPISGDVPEPLVTGPKGTGLARLSPDGMWIVYMEFQWSSEDEPTAPLRMMRVPVHGGLPQFVLEPKNFFGEFECSRQPANICVLAETSADNKRLMLTAFDPLKGRGKLLRIIRHKSKCTRLFDGNVAGWSNLRPSRRRAC